MKPAQSYRIAVADVNGQARGKRLPAGKLDELALGSARMPLSALNVDVSGADIEDSPLLWESGDADGTLLPTGRGPMPMPWLDSQSELIPMWMWKAGVPFPGDPRHALARVLDRYAERGWTVIAATELEFYLLEAAYLTEMSPASAPGRAVTHIGEAILSLDELDAFDSFFTALYDGAEAMGIPAQSATSESGIGQFEINLDHRPAMRAADDAWLFKLLVRGLARRHGMAATFLAKPFADSAGNGLHMHFSVLDDDGRNIFDDKGPMGTDMLRHAVAGCLRAMRPSTLVFAPHGPSYARFEESSHAPINAVWGYENRTAAIRIPGGSHKARRIEHRVAGGCVNPYLHFAAILGAALNGMEDRLEPPAPIAGNAYEVDAPEMHRNWAEAIDDFEASEEIARIFHPDLIRNLVLTKRQEIARFGAVDVAKRHALYLESV
jgi:glutamine synthetase